MAATGETVETVAKRNNYSKFAFYDVLRGRTQSANVRRIIAETIGRQVADIWPEDRGEK